LNGKDHSFKNFVEARAPPSKNLGGPMIGEGEGDKQLLVSRSPPAEGSSVLEVPIDQLVISPCNVRKYRGGFSELADSIRENGIVQPLVVRPAGDKYEIVIGSRRYEAAKSIGVQKVPVIVKELSDAGALTQSLVENIHKENLTEDEEIDAVSRLYELYKKMKIKSPQETIAKILGKSQSWVSKKLTFKNLLKKLGEEFYSVRNKNEYSKLVEAGYAAKSIFSEEPEKQVEFIKTVQKLPQRKIEQVIKEIKTAPDLSIEEAIKKVQEAKPLVLTVEFSPSVAEALSKAAQEKNVSPEQIVRTAVQTWLKSQGYLTPAEPLLPSNNKTAKQQRRTKEEVIADILRACKGGIRQARLLTAANLCHSDLKLYTRQLARDGLLVIKGTPPSYFTTEKGERWLEGYRRWREGRFVL